jgi:hypothetical protein
MESDQSANEIAASYLNIDEFKSEAEVDPRKCECTRLDLNVCECWETLQAARAALSRIPIQNAPAQNAPAQNTPGQNAPGQNAPGQNVPGQNAPGQNAPGQNAPDQNAPDQNAASGERESTRQPTLEEKAEFIGRLHRKLSYAAREAMRARGDKVIPKQIDLWSAMLLLAPLGNDLAQELLGFALRPRTPSQMKMQINRDPTPRQERLFQDRRYLTLLYEALNAHPGYADCEPTPLILRWQELGIAIVESAYLVDWFVATHPMRALRIERDVKIKMRKQGWRV